MVLYLLNYLIVQKNQKDLYSTRKYISVSFSILVLLLWFIYWVNSVGFYFFGGRNCFLGYLWFLCFVDCVNILFWWNRRCDGFLHHIRFWYHFFISRVNSHIFVNCVNISDQQIFDIIQMHTWFLIFSLGASDLLGNGPLDF